MTPSAAVRSKALIEAAVTADPQAATITANTGIKESIKIPVPLIAFTEALITEETGTAITAAVDAAAAYTAAVIALLLISNEVSAAEISIIAIIPAPALRGAFAPEEIKEKICLKTLSAEMLFTQL